MANWFVIRNGKAFGPYSDSQLKSLASSRKITNADFIRREDRSSFIRAGDIKGLFAVHSNPNQSSVPVPQKSPVPPPLPTQLERTSKKQTSQNVLGKLVALFKAGPDEITLKGKLLRSVILFFGILIALPTGIVSMVLFLGYLDSKLDPKTEVSKDFQPMGEQRLVNLQDAPQQKKRAEAVSLSDGRPEYKKLFGYLAESEKLIIHGPDRGTEIDDTPFSFVKDLVGEDCRVHIGGREEFGQNVSAIIFETVSDQKVAAMILGSPLNVRAPITRGNDLTSIGTFLQRVLPDAHMRETIKNKGGWKLMSDGGIVEQHGKAEISIRHDMLKNEILVVIVVQK